MRSSNIWVKWYATVSDRKRFLKINIENLKMGITSHLESLYALYNLYNLSLLYKDKLVQKRTKLFPTSKLAAPPRIALATCGPVHFCETLRLFTWR